LSKRAGGIAAFAATVADSQARFSASGTNQAEMSITRIDAGALGGHFHAGPHAAVELVAGIAVLAIAAAALWRLRPATQVNPSRRTGADDFVFPRALGLTALCTGILLAVYHQAYDGLLLTLPLVALVAASVSSRAQRTAGIMLALLLAVPMVNYLSSFSALS